MVLKEKIILPGEKIGAEEEYVSGENTFVRDGQIFSKTIGKLIINHETKEARIDGKKIEELSFGDIIVGKVTLVKESSAVIELISAEDDKRITGIKVAQLPIRNVSNEYVKDLKTMLKIGDYIRARIVMSSPLAIDLTTKEKGLGVIKAYCSKCRKEMNFNNNKMVCLECGSIEDRKWFEKIEEERQFTPREDRPYNSDFRRGNRGEQRNSFRREGNKFGGQNRGFGSSNFRGNSSFNRKKQSNFGQRNSF
ncbi:MAG: exosome complex RNA-binding protein Csl4 [Candidatus ainarchaeum sp.]|nr:exosome complex RNA-binding protein Csl4 [Candidatus ainarchaeum sp.]MDD4128639.1 exosome complex RNA-binding protein Csl4 [Candidatus ainarchaeum sp.]HPM85852.1 exosome complex RNA-binding protein Csl4 [archaeon]